MTVGLVLDLPGHWMDRAACGNRCDDLFFPIGTRGSDFLDDQMAEALAYCNRCPVQQDCLEWALEAGIGHGIWCGRRFDDVPLNTRRQWRDQLRAQRRRWSA